MKTANAIGPLLAMLISFSPALFAQEQQYKPVRITNHQLSDLPALLRADRIPPAVKSLISGQIDAPPVSCAALVCEVTLDISRDGSECWIVPTPFRLQIPSGSSPFVRWTINSSGTAQLPDFIFHHPQPILFNDKQFPNNRLKDLHEPTLRWLDRTKAITLDIHAAPGRREIHYNFQIDYRVGIDYFPCDLFDPVIYNM